MEAQRTQHRSEQQTLPRRVLVTGADGKIGRAVVADLRARGAFVTALSPQWHAPTEADRVVTGDATAEADIQHAMADVTAVVHLGALAHPDHGSPYEVYRTNTDATFNVLAQAGQRGIARAVIASSINAFGVPLNHHDVLPAYFPIDEDIPALLDDWYSLSKRSDELTAQMAASRWGMTIVAIRYPAVLTESERVELARHAGLQQAREGWSYIDLRDAVEATVRALVAPVDGATVVSIAAETTYMDRDTEDLLAQYAPTVPRRRAFPGRSGLVDTTRARKLLGFEPRHHAGGSTATTL